LLHRADRGPAKFADLREPAGSPGRTKDDIQLSQTAYQTRLDEISLLKDAGSASQFGSDGKVRFTHPHLPPNHVRSLTDRQGDQNTEHHHEQFSGEPAAQAR
jgi:hypothetical protein